MDCLWERRGDNWSGSHIQCYSPARQNKMNVFITIIFIIFIDKIWIWWIYYIVYLKWSEMHTVDACENMCVRTYIHIFFMSEVYCSHLPLLSQCPLDSSAKRKRKFTTFHPKPSWILWQHKVCDHPWRCGQRLGGGPFFLDEVTDMWGCKAQRIFTNYCSV